MAKILGSFTLIKSEGFDEFMKALGVGMVMRKMGNAVTPTIIISETEGEYTVKTTTTFKTTELKFRLNKEFTETTMDGREAQTTFTLAGDTLTQKQVPAKGPESTYTRIFTDAELTTICEVAGIKSTRVYKRN